MIQKVTQKDLIFTFFTKNPNMEYTPLDISKQFPTFARSSVRRILPKLLKEGKLIRETRGHYNINDKVIEKIYRKIVKIGASCGGKFRNLCAVTFEYDEEPRETELIKKIEAEFPNCSYINYDTRDLTDYEGIFVRKKDDIEDYGYSQEEYEDPVTIDQFFPNIEAFEE